MNTSDRPVHPPTYAELKRMFEEKCHEVDILKKNQAQVTRRIQGIITNFPLGLILVNSDQRIQALNKRAVAVFEYEPEELVNKPIDFIFPDNDAIEQGREPVRVNGRRKSGEVFAAEICVNLLEMQGEERYFVNVQDITERQRLEQLRRDLMAMVSHDIRGPLTAIRVVLDMVAEGIYGALSPRGEKAIGNAQSAVEYLIGLVKNLLDAEKTESGTIEIDMQETTVGAIVSKAVITADGAKERDSVRIEQEVTNDVLIADEDRIVQVLINLISNAIKYSPDDSVVRVVAGIEGLSAKFQVIDSGPGVPKDKQHLVFERYRQLDQKKDVKKQGFGLGLAICKALVEKHKGKIWVESEPGRGSNFCFTIPLSPE
ncbi:MAG: PAS domain S-box protein [Cyanobacteria bacterium HKST-UBA02]|nr:PAS domain S-box protein [Cyanobacteria bacterium HKST-UBA02]